MTGRTLVRRIGWPLFWLSLLGLLSWYYASTTPLRHLDSVFLFEAVNSIIRTGVPASATVASWPMFTPMIGASVPTICTAELPFPAGNGYNVLDNHAYFGLYPIALVASALGVELTFALLNAAAHLTLVLLPFVFLRRAGLGIVSASAFSVCVAAYPAWSLSAVGDYYLDRLYMPVMLALLYLLHRCVTGPVSGPIRRLSIGVVVTALAAAALTERATIMVIATLVFFGLFFVLPGGRWRGQRWLYIGLPALLLVYLGWYFGFLYQGFEGSGTLRDNARLSPAQLIERFRSPAMLAFWLTHLLFLGWMALMAGWRYVLLALGAMLPNVVVTTGGAELNGWSTHYHAMYVPFLVFVASLGFARWVGRLGSERQRAGVAIGCAAVAVLLAAYFNPYEGTLGPRATASGHHGIVARVYKWVAQPGRSPDRAMLHWSRMLGDAVPEGARVSAVEAAMPMLYRAHALALFPVGLDQADFLVVAGVAENGTLGQLMSFQHGAGAAASLAVNQCLHERMLRQGFVLDREIRGASLLVFRRAGP